MGLYNKHLTKGGQANNMQIAKVTNWGRDKEKLGEKVVPDSALMECNENFQCGDKFWVTLMEGKGRGQLGGGTRRIILCRKSIV